MSEQRVLDDLNQRLDTLEEFHLPDIVEEPSPSVSSYRDQHLGPAKVKPFRKIELVKSNEAIIMEMILDGIVIAMFIFSCYLLYISIVWTIWS